MFRRHTGSVADIGKFLYLHVDTFMSVIVALLCFVVLSSCAATATPMPVQEMSDARQAISVAKSVVPQGESNADIQQIEIQLKQAESALNEGEYAAAREHAIAARQNALKIQQQFRSTGSSVPTFSN